MLAAAILCCIFDTVRRPCLDSCSAVNDATCPRHHGQVRRLAVQHAAAFQLLHLQCSAAAALHRNSARPPPERVPEPVFLRLVQVRLLTHRSPHHFDLPPLSRRSRCRV